MTITATPLPRCPVRACPVRYVNGGSDRLCRDHDASDIGDLADRIAELTAAPDGRNRGDHPALER